MARALVVLGVLIGALTAVEIGGRRREARRQAAPVPAPEPEAPSPPAEPRPSLDAWRAERQLMHDWSHSAMIVLSVYERAGFVQRRLIDALRDQLSERETRAILAWLSDQPGGLGLLHWRGERKTMRWSPGFDLNEARRRLRRLWLSHALPYPFTPAPALVMPGLAVADATGATDATDTTDAPEPAPAPAGTETPQVPAPAATPAEALPVLQPDAILAPASPGAPAGDPRPALVLEVTRTVTRRRLVLRRVGPA